MRPGRDGKRVAPTAKIKAVQPLGSQNNFPAPMRQPEKPGPRSNFKKVVEIPAAHIPGNIFDRVGIEADIGTKLKQTKTLVGLPVANPARVAVVVGKIRAAVHKPIAAPEEKVAQVL